MRGFSSVDVCLTIALRAEKRANSVPLVNQSTPILITAIPTQKSLYSYQVLA